MDKTKREIQVNSGGSNLRADVIAASLLVSGADESQVVIEREGRNRNDRAPDIRQIKITGERTDEGKPVVSISTNRRAISDLLPEGLFFPASFVLKQRSREEILEEIRRTNLEEYFVRRFFRVFEQTIDEEQMLMRRRELEYDHENISPRYVNLFAQWWPFLKLMPLQGASLFLRLLPHFHTIRRSLTQVGTVLSLLSGQSVTVCRHKFIQRITDGSSHRHSRMRLGIDAVLRGKLDNGEYGLLVTISGLKAEDIKDWFEGGNKRRVLVALNSMLLEAVAEVRICLDVVPEHRQAFLKGDDAPHLCYLGINARLK